MLEKQVGHSTRLQVRQGMGCTSCIELVLRTQPTLLESTSCVIRFGGEDAHPTQEKGVFCERGLMTNGQAQALRGVRRVRCTKIFGAHVGRTSPCRHHPSRVPPVPPALLLVRRFGPRFPGQFRVQRCLKGVAAKRLPRGHDPTAIAINQEG